MRINSLYFTNPSRQTNQHRQNLHEPKFCATFNAANLKELAKSAKDFGYIFGIACFPIYIYIALTQLFNKKTDDRSEYLKYTNY